MIDPNKGNSSLNTLVGIIDNAMSRISTSMPVEVLKVDTKAKILEVMPMVSMLDNAGRAVPHAPISNIPYVRLQGGKYGLIIDPQVGDKGLVVFASRDISKVVETKQKTIPGSFRKHSMSDGIYVGSILMEEPTVYIKITDDLVEIDAKNIKIKGDVAIDGNADITGKLTVANGATITGDANIAKVSFAEHTHMVVHGSTEPPTGAQI